MDEIAALAAVDPIEFRLRYVQEPRAKAVLTAAAERARWDHRPKIVWTKPWNSTPRLADCTLPAIGKFSSLGNLPPTYCGKPIGKVTPLRSTAKSSSAFVRHLHRSCEPWLVPPAVAPSRFLHTFYVALSARRITLPLATP